MKFICVFVLTGICALSGSKAVAPRYNNPVAVPTPAPAATMAQDLDEIARMIPQKAIQRLVIRYLLNDAQFQTFVRIINSHDGYLTQMRFRSQPEVISFITWFRSQLMLSGGELESGESNESLRIINRAPFWSQNVFGWQGFVNEFHLYYPEDMIRMHIQTKSAQSPVFRQFIQRLKNLKPAYDRVLAMPEAQRLTASLEDNGIATAAIDNFIRNQFEWQQDDNGIAAEGPQLPKI